MKRYPDIHSRHLHARAIERRAALLARVLLAAFVIGTLGALAVW